MFGSGEQCFVMPSTQTAGEKQRVGGLQRAVARAAETPRLCIASYIHIFDLQHTSESPKRFLSGRKHCSKCVLERQTGSTVKKKENKVRNQWMDITCKVISTIRPFFRSFNYVLSSLYLPGTQGRVGYTKANKRERCLDFVKKIYS